MVHALVEGGGEGVLQSSYTLINQDRVDSTRLSGSSKRRKEGRKEGRKLRTASNQIESKEALVASAWPQHRLI